MSVTPLIGFLALIGFDAAYRLDRIGSRYTTIEDERSRPHTVHPLNTVHPLSGPGHAAVGKGRAP